MAKSTKKAKVTSKKQNKEESNQLILSPLIKPNKGPIAFAFPSLRRSGLTHYVKVSKDLDCSCEAKLYRSGQKPCYHIKEVRLGEAVLPEHRPNIDVLLGILKGLDVFILTEKDKPQKIFMPSKDISIDDVIINGSSSPRSELINEIKSQGYENIGVFFDPIVSNRQALKMYQGNALAGLDLYLLRSLMSNSDVLEKDNGFGITQLDSLELVFDEKPITRIKLIKNTLQELQDLDYNKIEKEAKEYLQEVRKTESLPKHYWRVNTVSEAEFDIEEFYGKRKKRPLDMRGKPIQYLFIVRDAAVKRNIAKGVFLRKFIEGCYEKIEQEISREVYHLPTHQLEKIYEELTDKKMKNVRLLTKI